MQHPDEGTIHSWLDNALSAEEAARVESHVAECAQCAATVAEARGFIAASSRILTALDDVPRGVVPAVPARKRDLRVLWRAAAAVLVVAGGSLIVMRDGEEMRPSLSVSDSVSAESKPPATGVDAAATAQARVPTTSPQSDASVASASGSKRRATSLTVRPSEPRTSVDRPLFAKGAPQEMGVSGRAAGAQAAPVDLAAPTIARTAEMQLSGSVGTGQREVPPLIELSRERSPGSRRIVYQIPPTDTVTLTEIESLSLQSVVTTEIASARDRQEQAVRTRAVAPTRTEAATAAPPQVAPLADSGRAQNTVRWVESATGKTLILSGNLPVEKLQEIRQRIEMERAAARKKTP